MAGRILDYRIALQARELELILWDSLHGHDVFVVIPLDTPCTVRAQDGAAVAATLDQAFVIIDHVLRGDP